MPIDPKLLQQASKTASLGDDVTPALKFLAPTVAGAGIGAIPGAALGAAYNGLFGKPEHFYDDIGRGTLRGALTGGGAGLGMSVGSEIGGDDIGTRLGGRVGGLTGHLLGKYLVARPEEEDEGLRIETRRTRSRKAQKKEAKVYEAAESVDGMKPKEVYESHKKCTPGEFGMNKEGEDANPSVQPIPRPYNPGNNAALQAALAVALPVAGAAGGVGLGGLGGGVLGAVHGAVSPGEYPEQDEEGNVQMRRRNRLLGALRGGGAGVLMGAGVGGLGGGALGAYTARKRIAELSKQSAAAHTTNNERVSLMTKQSAFEFGAHVKQALGPVGYGAAGGGLIGAGLGLSMQTVVIALQNAVEMKDLGIATSANTSAALANAEQRRKLHAVYGQAAMKEFNS
ncbi:hypothetical protein EBZ39_10815, partial [bacterium]|nr:hypothetical protein [bacterium]